MGYTADWESKVTTGTGWSYGVEFLAQRKIGPVTGWIGYTWSRTMRQFDEINYGKPFHAKYDREHDLSITLQYQITPRIDIAGTWVYATGNRGTLVSQVYIDPWIGTVEYFSERNGYQLPDYHRLDLAANFHFPHKRSENGKKGKADGRRLAAACRAYSKYQLLQRLLPYEPYVRRSRSLLRQTIPDHPVPDIAEHQLPFQVLAPPRPSPAGREKEIYDEIL